MGRECGKLGNLKEIYHLKDVGVDERIILKSILLK
jgi:hypothetical protein